MSKKELQAAKALFEYIRGANEAICKIDSFSPALSDFIYETTPLLTDLTDILLDLLGLPPDTYTASIEEWYKTGIEPDDFGFCRENCRYAAEGSIDVVVSFDDLVAFCKGATNE